MLKRAVDEVGAKNWKRISVEYLQSKRSDVQCLHRWQKVLKPGLVKGPWTAEEDATIVNAIKAGLTKWSEIAGSISGRIGKQCRERWFNHLDPSIKKCGWSEEEDRILVEYQEKLGNRWCEIAKELPGRSENSVKNRWNSAMRRKFQQRKDEKGIFPRSPPNHKSINKERIKVQSRNTVIAAREQLEKHEAISGGENCKRLSNASASTRVLRKRSNDSDSTPAKKRCKKVPQSFMSFESFQKAATKRKSTLFPKRRLRQEDMFNMFQQVVEYATSKLEEGEIASEVELWRWLGTEYQSPEEELKFKNKVKNLQIHCNLDPSTWSLSTPTMEGAQTTPVGDMLAYVASLGSIFSPQASHVTLNPKTPSYPQPLPTPSSLIFHNKRADLHKLEEALLSENIFMLDTPRGSSNMEVAYL